MTIISSVESIPKNARGSERAAASKPAVEPVKASVAPEQKAEVAAPEQKAEAAEPISSEEATELAGKFAEAINRSYGTHVRFNVLPREEGPHSFRFQVLDSKTGEVVREFPAEAVLDVTEGRQLPEGQGLFLDAPA